MELIIMFIVIVGMYFLGYMQGFDKCDSITQDALMQFMEEYIEEMEVEVGKEGEKN